MGRRSIFHLSDLHFGRQSDLVVESLLHFLSTPPVLPDLVIVSGDLTQRARQSEFRAARSFLDRLPGRVVSVPGNHDVSLHRPLRRFFWPFARYDEHIGAVFPETYEDDDLCVVGIRTNRLFAVADGKLRERHVTECAERFENPQAQHKLKLLVCHHPLLESLDDPKARRIFATGPDLVLSGHTHLHALVKVQLEKRTVLSLTAGTAVSQRTRDQENGFNWIQFDPADGRGEVKALRFGPAGFSVQETQEFSVGRSRS